MSPRESPSCSRRNRYRIRIAIPTAISISREVRPLFREWNHPCGLSEFPFVLDGVGWFPRLWFPWMKRDGTLWRNVAGATGFRGLDSGAASILLRPILPSPESSFVRFLIRSRSGFFRRRADSISMAGTSWLLPSLLLPFRVVPTSRLPPPVPKAPPRYPLLQPLLARLRLFLRPRLQPRRLPRRPLPGGRRGRGRGRWCG